MKYGQSKFIIEIAKWIIAHFNMDDIKIEHILFVRVPIARLNKPCEIYKLDPTLQKAFGFYYIIEVYPEFDRLYDHLMYKEIYHCLRHIPSNYQTNHTIVPHDFEMFEQEHLFTDKFKETIEHKTHR